MAASTIRVRGLREMQRDFRKMEGDLAKETRKGLKEAAEPVRKEAQALFEHINARSAAGYRVVSRARGVSVEQRYRRTTGKRPDYGRRQMGRALIPALEAKADDVVKGIEKVFDQLAGRNGF